MGAAGWDKEEMKENMKEQMGKDKEAKIARYFAYAYSNEDVVAAKEMTEEEQSCWDGIKDEVENVKEEFDQVKEDVEDIMEEMEMPACAQDFDFEEMKENMKEQMKENMKEQMAGGNKE